MQVRPPGLPATRTPLADALDIGNTVLQLDTLTQSRLATISTAEMFSTTIRPSAVPLTMASMALSYFRAEL